MRAVSGCLLERLDHVEAVDVRHHQIEHDQIRQLPARHLDRLAAAIRAQHGAGQVRDADGDQLHRFRIVVDHEDLERIGRAASGNRPSSTSESYSSCREIGFCITAAAPSAKPLLRSATIEMITTGTQAAAPAPA